METATTRCNHCRNRAETTEGPCPVCGLDPRSHLRDLGPAQRRVRRKARHIRLVAMVHLTLAGLGILMLPELPKPGAIVAISTVNLVLAIGLIRYALWGYKAAVVAYFLFGMASVVNINPVGMATTLLLLYLVGNGTAKAIFERRLPGA